MGAVVATVVQYSYNEVNLARLRHISKLKQENRQAVKIPVIKPQNSHPDPASTTTWMDVFLKAIGLTPITDEEYIAKMKKTRGVYLNRIEELQAQLELEEQKK